MYQSLGGHVRFADVVFENSVATGSPSSSCETIILRNNMFFLFFMDKFSEVIEPQIAWLSTLQQTAEHDLKQARYPTIRNIHRISRNFFHRV